jgi:hypothetical protein
MHVLLAVTFERRTGFPPLVRHFDWAMLDTTSGLHVRYSVSTLMASTSELVVGCFI